jgi:hypothetical protein
MEAGTRKTRRHALNAIDEPRVVGRRLATDIANDAGLLIFSS